MKQNLPTFQITENLPTFQISENLPNKLKTCQLLFKTCQLLLKTCQLFQIFKTCQQKFKTCQLFALKSGGGPSPPWLSFTAGLVYVPIFLKKIVRRVCSVILIVVSFDQIFENLLRTWLVLD